jgi:hypothetical protein
MNNNSEQSMTVLDHKSLLIGIIVRSKGYDGPKKIPA